MYLAMSIVYREASFYGPPKHICIIQRLKATGQFDELELECLGLVLDLLSSGHFDVAGV